MHVNPLAQDWHVVHRQYMVGMTTHLCYYYFQCCLQTLITLYLNYVLGFLASSLLSSDLPST